MTQTQTESPTWETVRQRINGLWSRYKPTEEERALIVRRLSGLNQRWLDAAVDSYFAASTSTVFRLAECLEHYRRIANAGEERATAARAAQGGSAVEWNAERERDRQEAIRALSEAPREEVRAAVEWLRAKRFISDKPLPARFEEWRTTPLLFVYCVLTRGKPSL